MKKLVTLKPAYIILSMVIFSIAVTFTDAVIHPAYFTKIMVKVLLFIGFPVLFFFFNKDERIELKSLFRFKKKGFLLSLVLGAVIYTAITTAYFLIGHVFDFGSVTDSLSQNMGISHHNFIWVALYISVLNSLLEEFFFRGFGFLTLKKYISGKSAYILSPVLFAIYHVGMMGGMFKPALLVLSMAGLIIGGIIFDALNEKFGNLYPSWFVHMAADAAIMTVGAHLFGLIG